jgi:phosphatidylglycerophosphatase C
VNLALFDFDGTISYGNTFTPFLHFAVDRKRIAAGRVVLAPVIAGYKLGFVSGSTARESATRFGFRGKREADVRRAGASYARDVLPGVIRPNALERIRWHKAQGDRVAVVSASLNMYLDEWCRPLELDVICTELDARDGILTGRYRQGDCIGDEKPVRILRKYRLQDYPVVYAYGDSEDDRPMLSIAARRYFQWREEN